MVGIVKAVKGDRGFAWVSADGVDYFAHASEFVDVVRGRRTSIMFSALAPGDRVRFEAGDGGAKGPRAIKIELLDEAA